MRPDTVAAMAKRGLLEAGFRGTPDGVREALGALRHNLEQENATEEEMAAAELVVAEALNNVVEHALSGSAAGPFQLKLTRALDGVAVEIRDRGHAMPDNRAPIGNLPEITSSIPNLPEGGFGWFLIRELARDLEYERVAGENRLTFRLAICV